MPSIKEIVTDLSYVELRVYQLHMAIQGTLDIYQVLVGDGEWDEELTNKRLTACVNDSFQEFNLEDDELDTIERLITVEYQDELTALNKVIVSHQRSKAWAYLNKYE